MFKPLDRQALFTRLHQAVATVVARSRGLQHLTLHRLFRRPLRPGAGQHPLREAQIYQLQGSRAQTPLYVTRSTLERLVLHQARSLTWGIGAVVVAHRGRDDAGAGNWRVAGIASGTADREEAGRAVAAAARRYAAWVMVEDGDRRADRRVER